MVKLFRLDKGDHYIFFKSRIDAQHFRKHQGGNKIEAIETFDEDVHSRLLHPVVAK